MPQEFQVLRCFGCETFQVQIVKKVPKWICKICLEKQSIKKVYFSGTGKECRQIVQDFNRQRIENKEELEKNLEETPETFKHEGSFSSAELPKTINGSKWEIFVSKTEKISEDEDSEDGIFCFENVKRKREVGEGSGNVSFGKCRKVGEVFEDLENRGFCGNKWDAFLDKCENVQEGEIKVLKEKNCELGVSNKENPLLKVENILNIPNIFETNDNVDDILDF